MKSSKLVVAFVAVFSFAIFAAPAANAQFGKVLKKTQDSVKEKTKGTESKTPSAAKTETKTTGGKTAAKSNAGSDGDSDERSENAENLAKAAGMPKAANTDAALNKLLFQAADDHRLVPRRIVVTDKDYLMTTDARGTKVRRIFAVVARTLDDGSGKCGKQMVQFDQDFREGKWGAVYVQNIGAITPIACSAIGK